MIVGLILAAAMTFAGCQFTFFADYPPDPGDVASFCDPSGGDACAAGASKICKRRPLENRWRAEIAGSDVYRATVHTMWCWRGDSIVSRHSDNTDHYVTSFGKGLSISDNGVFWDDSYCTDSPVSNYTCVTQAQYGFTCNGCVFPLARVYGGCVATRIWGASRTPNHYRRAYGGTCAD